MLSTLRSKLSHVTGPSRDDCPTDGQLLDRFREQLDEEAFAELVLRHGPMVFGVCQRMLACRQDAEDAFQATFLVLAVKPAAVRPPDRVGAWLHGVACRAALKARRSAARRNAAERVAAELRRPRVLPDTDLASIFDEVLLALPEKYRLPVLECHLGGRSRKEAAERLGCSEGTLSGRLSRALDLLARRLTRRGVGLPATALAGALATGSLSAGVPVDLTASTLRVANMVRDGLFPAASSVAVLTRGVLSAMWWKKFTMLSIVVVAAGAMIASLSLLAPGQAADPPGASQRAQRLALVAVDEPKPGPKTEWKVRQSLTREHAVLEIAVREEMVAFADEGGNVCLWKLGAKEPETIVKRKPKGQNHPAANVTYAPNGKFVYFTGEEGKALLRHEFERKGPKTYGLMSPSVAHIGFSQNGDTWIETFPDKRSAVWLRSNSWDAPRAELEKIRFDADVTQIVFAPNGNRLAATTTDGTIHIIDREGLKVAHKIAVKDLRANAVRFSPDGKTLAVVGENGFARLYDVAAGTEQAQLKGFEGLVFAVAFSPDGKTVAAGGDDNLVRLWDAKSGKSLAVLKGHAESVRAVSFIRDGKTLLTGSSDKTLKVWELAK